MMLSTAPNARRRAIRFLPIIGGLLSAGCGEGDRRDPALEARTLSSWAAAVDTLPGTYTRVVYPSAFGDSLLIVSDVGENAVWRADRRSGERTPFGSVGGGPGEYARAGWSMRVRGDSVVVTRPGWKQPFAVLSVANGRGRSLFSPLREAPIEEEVRGGFLLSPFVTHADTLGGLYGIIQWLPIRRDLVAAAGDTFVPVVRFSLDGGAPDTVFLAGASTMSRRNADPARRDGRVRLGLGMYGTETQWTIRPDARSVEVDGARYHVRLRDADGTVRDSFTLATREVPVTDSAWTAHVESQRRQQAGLIQMSLRGIGAEQHAPDEKGYIEPDRPSVMPPVRGDDALRVAGDLLWVPVNDREPPAPPTYDLVHLVRRARLARLVLAANERVVLATPTTLYVVAKDEDDLERLIAYRVPAADR